ncbi:MAG: DUF6031 family protein [Rhizobiaceae bacterium]|nr:DUF6031 family protein [Rhizobiaceae bacterium]
MTAALRNPVGDTVLPHNAMVDRTRFFPGIGLDFSADGAGHVRKLVEIAWLIMAEGHPIIEDMDGAIDSPELMQSLKYVFAEFLADLDQRIAGGHGIASAHHLALAAEHGTTGLARLTGPEFCTLLGLDDALEPAAEHARATALWARLLADFPIALVDPLQPENQGAVLTALRKWTKLCNEAGIEADFLVELMKAV